MQGKSTTTYFVHNVKSVICVSEVDDCQSNPCVHGICVDALYTFKCQCESGFTGATCDVNIDDCDVHVCINDGRCVDGVLGYTCACSEHFTGEYCETEVGQCLFIGIYTEAK